MTLKGLILFLSGLQGKERLLQFWLRLVKFSLVSRGPIVNFVEFFLLFSYASVKLRALIVRLFKHVPKIYYFHFKCLRLIFQVEPLTLPSRMRRLLLIERYLKISVHFLLAEVVYLFRQFLVLSFKLAIHSKQFFELRLALAENR